MHFERQVRAAVLVAAFVVLSPSGGVDMAFSSDFGVGTLIGNLSQRFGTGKMLRQKLEDERRANYGEDLWAKMEAWKAAGLHPLVGMGIGSEGPVVGYKPPEPHFRFSSEPKVDPDTQRLRRAQADMAELQVKEAQRRLAGQPGNQGGGVLVESDEFGAPAAVKAQTGEYRIQPSAITSVSRSIPFQTAGPRGASETSYGFRNPVTGETATGNLPAKDISEPLEGMGEFWKAIIGTPMGGKLMWDVMVPDEWKKAFFDWADRFSSRDRSVTGTIRRPPFRRDR